MSVSKLNLPPIDKWRQYFAIAEAQRLRTFIRHPETAQKLAEAFVPEGSKDLIIIEAAAGPGQLTRALLNLPKERIKKLIVLETPQKLLDFLTPLEEVDSRVRVFPLAPKTWNSYTQLFQTGLLDDLEIVDWEQVHPQFRFVMHLSGTVEGEQLLSQFLRAIPDRQWLFRYGRVPMNFVLSSRMWERLRVSTSAPARCKVSVMAQAAADLSEAVPYDSLQPFQDHFHPTVPKQEEINSRQGLNERRTGNPMSAISVIPSQHQASYLSSAIEPGDLDYWDFCLRKLFVQKATSVEKCISLLGPGAKNILPKLTDKTLPAEERVDVKKTPRGLDIREWSLLVRAFKEWPFRPEDLSINNFFDNQRDG
ncbi:S-adenosyl-L-methionine-dependent methyltransferase [Phlegmacium glaucopus]|nr:S-adenosyl-L-methionine-dependent methyltransferase [Phlegmacium glaucopus]